MAINVRFILTEDELYPEGHDLAGLVRSHTIHDIYEFTAFTKAGNLNKLFNSLMCDALVWQADDMGHRHISVEQVEE
jgi:hypothetical protein